MSNGGIWACRVPPHKEEEDTTQHTLEFCPAWEEPRRILRLVIGESLAPEAVVGAMLRGHQEFMRASYAREGASGAG